MLRLSFLSVLSFLNFVAKKLFTRTSGVLTVHFMCIYSEFEHQSLLISIAGYIWMARDELWMSSSCMIYGVFPTDSSWCASCLCFFQFGFKSTDSNILGVFISSYVVMKSQISCFRMGIKCSLGAFSSEVMFIWKLVALFQNQVSCLQRQHIKSSNYTS